METTMLSAEELKTRADDHMSQWLSSERLTTRMLNIVNGLRLKGILCHVCGRSIAKTTVQGSLKAIRHSGMVLGEQLSVQDIFPVVDNLETMGLGPCRIDVGKVAVLWREARKGNPNLDLTRFLSTVLRPALVSRRTVLDKPQDVILYGFGRIGRLLARILVDKTGRGDKIRVRAAVVRPTKVERVKELKKRAALLRLDSVHGAFPGITMIDEAANAIVADGNMIQLLFAEGPDQIDYTRFGIEDAIVVDNTGKWRDRDGLGRHLNSPGVRSVLLTAPGKGDIPNIVYGVNDDTLDPSERLVSAASCTTNAIVPVLKVINDRFGIEGGHIETVHAFTNDQNLIDNYHKSARRGRSALMNMVITETGAATAVAKVLPELKGKLTGNAIRVPIPDVSMAILKLTLGKGTSREEINECLRRESLEGPLRNQIDYTTSEDVVSSDLVGSRYASIVDSAATIVNDSDSRNVVLYVWYDNEFGYACQAMRVLQRMSGINDATLPDLPFAT